MHGLLAVQAGLERRDRTGDGAEIELAQLEALLGLTAAQVIAASTDTPLPMRAGNRHPTSVPHGIYPCAGVDEWIAIAVNDEEWPAFVEAVGRPDLAFDARFATPNGRRVHHFELDAAITAWSSRESSDGAEAALVGAGVRAARVAHASSLHDDEQLRARDFFQAIARPATGTYDYPGWPMRFSFGPPTPHQRPAPTLGQHTDEILEHILGLTNDEIERLRRLGVL
jgi:crotonobetainyl-CoA:carnitine CoA-transferase CaiB-like acyl-CoA transferase